MEKSTGFEIYNVGNGKSYSIIDLCKILENITNKTITIKSEQSLIRENDVNEIYSDNSRITKLGWAPTFSIKEGLQVTLKWFQHNLG